MSTDILNAMQNGHMTRTGHELVAHLEPAPTESWRRAWKVELS